MTSATLTSGKRGAGVVLIAAAIGFAATFVYVMMNLLDQGHAAYNTNSLGVVWGFPIVVYDYFLLTSTGLAMVAGLSLVLGIKEFDLLAKRCLWLSLSGLIGGVAALTLELGAPLRAIYAIPFNGQTASPLFWKVLLVVAYLVLMLVLFSRVSGASWERRPNRSLAIPFFVAAVLIALVAGSVYGMMAMRPFWFGGEIPVAFLVESFLGGLAFALFFTYLAHGFRQDAMPEELRRLFERTFADIFATTIGLHAAFVAGRAMTGLWSNAEGLEVWSHVTGSWLFHVEVWAGIVLPFVLMIIPGLRRSGVIQILAALLVMVSLFIARYDFIVGGQLVPLFKGSWAPGLIAYAPSATEWVLLLVAIFLANLVNAVGEWRFNLGAPPRDRE
jgi:molybdopterin-containing oxidoreductase family membrane subunit